MIRPEVLIIDGSIFYFIHQRFRYQEIIDTPAYVFSTGVEQVIPIGIFYFLRIKTSEGIYKAGFKQACKAIDLALGIACRFIIVFFRARYIYSLMGYVKIATGNNGLSAR